MQTMEIPSTRTSQPPYFPQEDTASTQNLSTSKHLNKWTTGMRGIVMKILVVLFVFVISFVIGYAVGYSIHRCETSTIPTCPPTITETVAMT